MRKLMEYKIISGNVIEIRRSYLNAQPGIKKTRGMRIAGNSSERKIKANEQEQTKKFARTINANIDSGWMLLSLNYNNETLPGSFDELEKNGTRFLRRLRESFIREYGHSPRYIFVNANWSPSKNRPARLHHHLLIEACSVDFISRLWKFGGTGHEDVDGRADHTALAVYLLHNVQLSKDQRGKKTWHTSKGNLAKPIYTEPKEVYDEVEDIKPIVGAQVTAFERTDDDDGKALSSYIRCIVKEKPRLKGSTVFFGSGKNKERSEMRIE